MRVGAADPYARVLADRHYPRQNVGAKCFTPPGWKVILRLPTNDAYWVSLKQAEEYVDHAWAGAWVCSAFRNESPHLSSSMIVEALAATVAVWGPPPTPRRRLERGGETHRTRPDLPPTASRGVSGPETGSGEAGKPVLRPFPPSEGGFVPS